MTSLPICTYLRPDKDGSVLLDVHVMPNAARTEIQGLHDGALRIRLHAPPVDGKANLALQHWLAECLGVPKSALELVRGTTARRKQWRVNARYVTTANWVELTPPAS
jgi:uncharacterized protein (TIGR00251 family)